MGLRMKKMKEVFRQMEEAGENTSAITTAGLKSIFEALVLNTSYRTSGIDTRYLLIAAAENGSHRRAVQDAFEHQYPDDIKRSLNEAGTHFCWQLTNKVLANTDVWEAFLTKPYVYIIQP